METNQILGKAYEVLRDTQALDVTTFLTGQGVDLSKEPRVVARGIEATLTNFVNDVEGVVVGDEVLNGVMGFGFELKHLFGTPNIAPNEEEAA
jgi:hypothetical protein